MTHTSDYLKDIDNRHCQDCQAWGGWLPIQVGDQISYTTHGRCKHPKYVPVIARPALGCCLWAPMTMAPNQRPAPHKPAR